MPVASPIARCRHQPRQSPSRTLRSRDQSTNQLGIRILDLNACFPTPWSVPPKPAARGIPWLRDNDRGRPGRPDPPAGRRHRQRRELELARRRRGRRGHPRRSGTNAAAGVPGGAAHGIPAGAPGGVCRGDRRGEPALSVGDPHGGAELEPGRARAGRFGPLLLVIAGRSGACWRAQHRVPGDQRGHLRVGARDGGGRRSDDSAGGRGARPDRPGQVRSARRPVAFALPGRHRRTS